MQTKDIEIGREYAYSSYISRHWPFGFAEKVRVVDTRVKRLVGRWGSADDGIAYFMIDEKGKHTTDEPLVCAPRNILRAWDEHERILLEREIEQKESEKRRTQEAKDNKKNSKIIVKLSKELGYNFGYVSEYSGKQDIPYLQLIDILTRLKEAEDAH